MKKVEVEIRTFISPSQYQSLMKKLRKIAKFKDEINEETIYCGSENLRIRKNDEASYLILKSGRIHQNFRGEIEIKFKREDFEKMKEILERIGFPVIAIWKRKRLAFDWNGTKVFLDDTKGYGKIIELEKITNEKNKEKAFSDLKSKLLNLGIKKITPKNFFDKKFKNYLKNWKKLI
jgi:predicted adenylyl cyclase CyaB